MELNHIIRGEPFWDEPINENFENIIKSIGQLNEEKASLSIPGAKNWDNGNLKIESGNFQPYFAGGTTAGSFTYGAQVGSFIQILDMVFISGNIRILTILSAASGILNIRGLPKSVNAGKVGGVNIIHGNYLPITSPATQITLIIANDQIYVRGAGFNSSLYTAGNAADLRVGTELQFMGFYYTN